ncbi:MAG: hypothetical protein K9M01_04730 [Candidatus Omnitrophica bacterium]|nr:hypothetical protein [Candidatus Omnitrophota bacterium]
MTLGMIPARLESERFNRKLLHPFRGERIINIIMRNARKFNVDKLVIATDSKELIPFIDDDIEFIYIKEEVSCGSERIKYVKRLYPDYDHYMSIPADEFLLDPEEVNRFLSEVDYQDDIYTLYSDFYSKDHWKDSNSCKIVADKKDYAMFFSRQRIPMNKNGSFYEDMSFFKKHIGVFLFSNAVLENNLWETSPIASINSLEQNMFLENGYKIKLFKIVHKYFGLDNPRQLAYLEENAVL